MPKTPEEIAAEAKAAAEKAAADKAAADAANGFPSDTPLSDMNAEQQAAYWRNEAKKQQKKAEEKSDYDKLKADSAELEKLREANQSEQDKLVDEARRNGEVIGAERYLKDAVKGRFQALTGKTDEEVDTAFAHVDPKSFTDDKGAIDAEKLKAFAGVFGKAEINGTPPDPVAAALARRSQNPASGGTSIADKRKATRESLTKTKA